MKSVPLRSSHDANVTRLAQAASEVGLHLRAVLPAQALPEETMARLDAWLGDGRAADMRYLERGRPCAGDLRAWKPWTRSVALFSCAYARGSGSFRDGGRVARYALGRDYHHVLGKRLQRLGRSLQASGVVKSFRAATDAAPVLEKEWAIQGQLGFRGKNTLVLDRQLGPWILLGELLTDAEWPHWPELPAGGPAASCGHCTRCLDACPTAAFPAPYQLDPRRCISYLTIEHRGPIARDLRPLLGDWVFGCDVCMEVCPFGQNAADRSGEWGRLAALDRLRLEDLLTLSPADYELAFRGSPIRRAGYAGLLRNACVALGNLGRGQEALTVALRHPQALVRVHAAWALGRMGERASLRAALAAESEPWAAEEMTASLDGG
ncbi:MAG: tRNA epoxyqueuosine(34) reductase QueG [Planctomycetota bacterium]|nr:MAG: tRNA epoxyqueuosine(34) reductase QueG [Planctomycetota bacterium]